MPISDNLNNRLTNLNKHLKEEHPNLVPLFLSYKETDAVLRKIGLISSDESMATRISWWPTISIVGVFSAGKSTFINDYLGVKLQNVGNQAVDDKFTVITKGDNKEPKTLPGAAIDADPRLPFYDTGNAIEAVAPGEGKNVDNFFQLKTVNSDILKGKLLVDSPGFDSDTHRASTLRLVDHIVDMSDLVLVLFDARKPEPGVLRDTLKHLVEKSVNRSDKSKFLYILNQIDTASNNDNIEEIYGAWQRTVAEAGLTSGDFYMVYSENSAGDNISDRIKERRKRDMAAIHAKINNVSMEREYRIANMPSNIYKLLEHEIIPELTEKVREWRSKSHTASIILTALLGLIVIGGIVFTIPEIIVDPSVILFIVLGIFASYVSIFTLVSKKIAKVISESITDKTNDYEFNLKNAFVKNAKPLRGLFKLPIIGWGKSTQKKLSKVRINVENVISKLNDKNSSGE